MNKVLKKLIFFPTTHLSQYWLKYSCYILMKVFNLITYIVQPFIWAYVLQNIYSDERKDIFAYIILFILVEFFQILSFYVCELLQNKLNFGMVTDLKGMMIEAVVNFKLSVINNTKVGEFVSKFHSDVVAIVDFWNVHLPNFLLESLKLLVMSIIIAFVDVKLFLTIMGIMVVFSVVFLKYGEHIQRRYTDFRKVADVYFANMHETMNNIREIKNLGLKNYSVNKSKDIFEKIRLGELSYNDLGVTSQFVTGSINTILLFVVLMYSALLVINGDMTTVKFVVFFTYVSRFGMSVKDISRINTKVQQGIVCFERVDDILSRDDNFEIDTQSGNEINEINCIKFENIKFSYNKDQNVLDNISCTIEPNTITAVVGPSGNGKSTFLNLLSRLYTDYDGDIFLGDMEIRRINENSFRKMVTRVYQEPLLFNMSIKDNLKLSGTDISDEMIMAVCKDVCLDSYIESLPNKYDTIINENSNNISVGQKQRLAIARSLLTGAKVLLLDEITSALDNETEDAILSLLERIKKDHTIIVVSHKITNIINSEQIIVINDGKVEGNGTHNDLIKTCNTYRRLYEMELNNN